MVVCSCRMIILMVINMVICIEGKKKLRIFLFWYIGCVLGIVYVVMFC